MANNMIARQTDQPLETERAADPTALPPGVRPDPTIGRGFWLLLFASMAIVGGFAYAQFSRVDAARKGHGIIATKERDLPVIGPVPDFTLTDKTGKKVSLADLKGKVWVADFVFTTCGGPCPIMTRRMRELHQALYARGVTDVVTVTFTVDPETDTPPVLTEYARQFDADNLNWLFLTGDVMSIYDLSRNGFKLPAIKSDDANHQVEHSPRFVLVDHRGQIRGYYEIVTDEEMELPRAEVIDKPIPHALRDKIISDIRWLQREARK
jgi:protein SCO1